MAGFDDFLSWLAGGTQMGNMLGIGSPTASTQAPLAVAPGTSPTASGPMLGGAPAGGGGLLSGLLGGRAPVNTANYFMPKPGPLGDSPLGNAVLGAFSGLGSGAGYGGLTGMGQAFTGGSQAVQDRRQNMMRTALAGQQYQAGQATAAASNIEIAEKLRQYNIMNRIYNPGAPDLTYADVINDPQKLSQIMSTSIPNLGGQPPAGGQAIASATAPIAPTILPPGQTPPTITSPTGVSTNPPPRSPIEQFNQARLQFEGGGDPNAVDPKSGAIAGLTSGTFDDYNKQFFGGKLNFANPADRQTVNDRLNNDLYKQSGGDVNRMAVGYFSGAGNMAPIGAPVPWINPNATDANGVNVVDYVNHIRKNLMLPPIDAGGVTAQAQPAVGGGQQMAAGAQPAGGLSDAAFAQAHPGFGSLAQYREVAALTGNTAMQAEADKWDPALIGGQKRAELLGTQGIEYGGPQKQYDRATKLADDYKSNKTVQLYGLAKPAADAFNAAFQERGQPGGSSDYAMVEAALQVLNPGVPVARPGTAEYATQLQTLPGQVAEQIKKAFDSNSAIPDPAAAQLKQAVDDRMAINQKLIGKVNESFRSRAKTDAPQVDESYWNPEGFGSEPAQAPASQAAAQDPHINPNTKAPYAKGDVVTDNNGKRWMYSGIGDSADKKNWKPYAPPSAATP